MIRTFAGLFATLIGKPREWIRAITLAAVLTGVPVAAQVVNQPPPAVISPLASEPDPNNINMTTGRIRVGIPTLAIPAAPRLKLDALQNAMPYLSAKVSGSPGSYIESSVSVHFGQETSDAFSCTFDDLCTNRKGQGSVLDGAIANGGPYSVTQGGTGAVYTFDRLSFDKNVNGTRQIIYYASSVVHPDGETISYSYETAPLGDRTLFRVTRISSSTGFYIDFSYQGTDPVYPAWSTVAQTTIYHYTAPSSALARLTYSASGTMTDLAGRIFTCVGCDFRVGGQVELSSATITLPGEAAAAQTINSSGLGYVVDSLVRDGVNWTYGYTNFRLTPSGHGYDQVNVTGPNGYNVTYNMTVPTNGPNRISSVRDSLLRTTSFFYDISGRLTSITYPEGNSVSVGYDQWGNILSRTATPKAGSGLAAIGDSAAIDTARCALVQVLCYRIASRTDALGRVTTYLHDDAGRLIEQTDPADASGVQRKTYYRYGAGGYSPNLVRVCGTGNPCGSNSEIRTEYSYWNGTQLPQTETKRDISRGISATTTFGYDTAGRLLSVDGPLPGTDDSLYYRYDVIGRRTWEIGPKGQAGLRKATRTTYRDSDDKPVFIEVGTVSDPASTILTVSERTDITYDSRRNAIRTTRSASGVTYAVLDKSFDDRGRVDCETVRMNLTALPAASATGACTAGTAGTQGPDRITRRIFDAEDQELKIQVGVGTTVAADEETRSFTPNGKLATVTDGENNRTTFEYDGHDRLSKTRYPVTTVGANASSTTDFEQLGYDAKGNVISRRLRDGQTIGSSYDALDRLILKDLPAPEADVSNSYDVANRLLGSSQAGHNLAYSFDALGRMVSQSSPLGTLTMDYDIAGRRTRLNWLDGLFIVYDYDASGNVTAIRENGALSGLGLLAAYSYDGEGMRTAITRGNGAITRYEYDPVDRLTGLQHDFAGTTSDVTYGRVGGVGAAIGFNPASQIVSASRDNDSYRWFGHFNVDRSYGTNGLNQLTSAGGTALGYDLRGNLTSSGTLSYGYTAENRMVSGPGGATLSYDPAGRLHQTSEAGGTRLFYDGTDLSAEYNLANQMLRRYVHGPGDDEPLLWYEGAGTADRRWLHQDERSSIVAISNSANSVIAINAYDKYSRSIICRIFRACSLLV